MRCKHIGEDTGRIEACVTCNMPQAMIHRCTIHGECTESCKVRSVRYCGECPDYQRTFAIRDLIYHIYPVKGTGIWQRNVERLKRSIGLFNGKKVVAIGVGEKQLDPPETVQAAFADVSGVEFLHFANDPSLREMVTFEPMASRIESLDRNRVFFFGHAKGVTRPNNPGVTCHTWTDILYETLLENYPVVEKVLGQYPVAGSFKKTGSCFGSVNSTWHYSGSFFWARSYDWFSGKWRMRLPKVWYGVETLPSLNFPVEQAGCVFFEAPGGEMDLYRYAYMHDVVLPRLQQWRERVNTVALVDSGTGTS